MILAWVFYFSKSNKSKPDWRNIERKVPKGISLRFAGTITVHASFLNFVWLPFWDTKINPLEIKIFSICFEKKA